MVIMPDGVQLDMEWKKAVYKNGRHSIAFEIVPMFDDSDILVFPDKQGWSVISEKFNEQERKEIAFLLERLDWKRDLRLIEVNITPIIDSDIKIREGSLESTEGYQKLKADNLFDPQSPLNKSEVRNLYQLLEKRFAEAVTGTVTIPKDSILEDSVLAQITIPTLKANEKVDLNFI